MQVQILKSSLLKTIYWLFFHTLFGLSPIWITSLLASFTLGIELSAHKVIEEGIVLFFCSTISAVATLDFVFSKIRFPKYIEFGFYFTPSFMLLASGIVFSQLYFHKDVEYNIALLLIFQNIILGFTFLYCLILKTIVFISES